MEEIKKEKKKYKPRKPRDPFIQWGQPPKIPDEKTFHESVIDYMDWCTKKKRLPNIAGFAFFLGIGRDTIYEYCKKYPDTKKRLYAFIESEWITRLQSNAPTGAIFYLKNAFRDYFKDRQEVDHTSKGEKIKIFNETQLQRIARRLQDGKAKGKK